MDIIYDTESFPNFWCLVAIPAGTDEIYIYEISDRTNQAPDLLNFLKWAQHKGHRMAGFNNLGYDYPMIHHLMTFPELEISANAMFLRNEQIIDTPWENRFSNRIAHWDVLIPQLDLFLIHHFDNSNTGLKVLEINMQSKDVRDLPFPPGTELTHEQMQTVLEYCIHDVKETKKFYNHSVESIKFRDSLTKKHGKDYTNHNDTKIGKDYFISELEERISPDICFSSRPRRPKQTIRDVLIFKDFILPYIKFHHQEFRHILDEMKNTTIFETKNVLKMPCVVKGLEYVFGTGGIHGCAESKYIKSCPEYAIIDLDVASYYSSVAIAGRFFPQHLTDEFCEIYADLRTHRKSFNKGTPENKMLKLALNGVYGDSNSKYSPFYDPEFTMSITINGQLLLCMLADWLLLIPDLSVIQINTDGLTVKIPHSLISMLDSVKFRWQKLTNLELEQYNYSDIWIRDVNNYIAVDNLGELKRKGAYEYNRRWHQNHSMLVIRKATEAHLVYGADIRGFIKNHENDLDFCLTAKVPKTSKLMWGDKQVQNTSRYVVSIDGEPLVKIMPPLPKNPTKERPIGISVEWLTTIANNGDIDREKIDYDFYVNEAKKLTECFD